MAVALTSSTGRRAIWQSMPSGDKFADDQVECHTGKHRVTSLARTLRCSLAFSLSTTYKIRTHTSSPLDSAYTTTYALPYAHFL